MTIPRPQSGTSPHRDLVGALVPAAARLRRRRDLQLHVPDVRGGHTRLHAQHAVLRARLHHGPGERGDVLRGAGAGGRAVHEPGGVCAGVEGAAGGAGGFCAGV
jgi:hypothetical protein